MFDSWDKFFDPTYLACPNTHYEMVVTDMQGDEVVVEAKKIKSDQVRDPGMLFPQWTGDGWTGWSDMTESWAELFPKLSLENLEALRQAIAEIIENANAVGNAVAVGKLCDMINLLVSAMGSLGSNGNYGYQFGSAMFHGSGQFGVSFQPVTRAFEGR